MKQLKYAIEYQYDVKDAETVVLTTGRLKDILKQNFTKDTIGYLLGSTESDESEDEMPIGTADREQPVWRVYHGSQFRNVRAKVVVRATIQAISLVDWIKSQSEY